MERRRFLRNVVTGASVALAGGAWTGRAWAQAKPEVTKLGLAFGLDPVFAPHMIAMQKGWFRDAGFSEVTTKTFSGGALAGEALVSGDIQLWTPGNLPPISMTHSGVPIVVLGTNSLAMAADWLVARKDANVRAPEDLYRTKIGLLQGSTASAVLYYLAKHYNLDEKRLQVVNMPPPEQLAGLNSNAIQAMLCWQPWGYNAMKGGNADLVHTGLVSGFAANKGQPVQVSYTRSLFVASQEFVTKNPIATRRMVEVLVRAQRYVADPKNRNEVVSLFVEQSKQDRALADAIWDQYTFDPVFDERYVRDMDRLSDYLVASGRLKSPKSPLEYTYTDPVAAVDPALVKVPRPLPALIDVAGKRIGVGMLGAGFIAGYHLAGLAATGRAVVRTIVARTPAGARALADRFGVADVGTDIAAALAREDIDAVVVATPDDTHEAVAIAAARAGKAVLLQKPMAGSLVAATRIAEAAAGHGIDLQVSFMHRFFDEVVEAKRWITEGALGRIHGARIRNATPGPDWGDWFFRKASVPHGVADQLGVHGIDLVEHLLGPIRNVGARARTAMPVRTLRDGRRIEVETVDNVNATYELDDGTLVSHEISQTEVAGCDRFRMEIYGERGTLWLRSERGRFAAVVPERYGPDWQMPTLDSTPTGKRQHDAWLAGVAGEGPRLTTARDALRGMRVVEAMMRSSDLAGARVDVAGVLPDTTDPAAQTAAEAMRG